VSAAAALQKPAAARLSGRRQGVDRVPQQQVRGEVRLVLSASRGPTRVEHLYQCDPLRLLRPNPAPGDPLTAVLLNTAGGLVAGDRLHVSVAAGAGSSALLVAQSAEKVYRSEGARVQVRVELTAAAGAWLEWLPQETILFDGARLCRQTQLELAAQARVLAGEILVLGRLSSGERFRRGALREAWQLRVDGRLVWLDALELEADPEDCIRAPAGFGGASACATLVHWTPQADERLQALRPLLPSGQDLRAGATIVNGLLLVRWLARDPLRLRQSYAEVWTALRSAAGFPQRLPRLWHA